MKRKQRLSGASLVMAGMLALAGCADPSTRIADELTRYGLDAQQATCVGERLEAGLSVGQLQELARAARAVKTTDTAPSRLTSSDLMRAASQIQDPRIAIEVAKAGAGCGILADAVAARLQ